MYEFRDMICITEALLASSVALQPCRV